MNKEVSWDIFNYDDMPKPGDDLTMNGRHVKVQSVTMHAERWTPMGWAVGFVIGLCS